MHPTFGYHLAHARIADLRQEAQRDNLARSARDAGRRCRLGQRPLGRYRTRTASGTARAIQSAALEWLAWHAATDDLRNEN